MTDIDLWILMKWMAETVYTSDFENEWYYMLLDVEDLLVVIGQQLIHVFSSIQQEI